MATILKQCHDCGKLFTTVQAMLVHRMKQHNWRPVGGLNASRNGSRERSGRRSGNLWVSRFAAVAVWLCAATCLAQGVEIAAPERAPEGASLIEIEATTAAGDVVWTIYPPESRAFFRSYRVVDLDDAGQPVEPKHLAILAAPPKGRYYVVATAVVDGHVRQDEHSIDVGGTGPTPPGPDPPQPPDPPEPPTPQFGPLRVLLVDETTAGNKHREAMSSTLVREYLDKHCERWADGRTPQKYFADQHESFRNMPSWWQGAMDRAKAKGVPAIVVYNGHTETVVAAPETPAAALLLLQSMGGP